MSNTLIHNINYIRQMLIPDDQLLEQLEEKAWGLARAALDISKAASKLQRCYTDDSHTETSHEECLDIFHKCMHNLNEEIAEIDLALELLRQPNIEEQREVYKEKINRMANHANESNNDKKTAFCWRCDQARGVVYALDAACAEAKIRAAYRTHLTNLTIWPWAHDNEFCPAHPDVVVWHE